MINILEIFKSIDNTRGNGSQKNIIETLKANSSIELNYALNIAFNPFIVTHIGSISIIDTINTDTSFETFQNLCEKTIQVKSLNNNLRLELSNFVSAFPVEYQQHLINIFTKSSNIGISSSTINKAYGKNFIPDPSVMLAKEAPIEENRSHWVEEKYDGVRLICEKTNGQWRFFSRNFRTIENEHLNFLEKDLNVLFKDIDNVFVDGELTDINRKTVSGQFNKMQKGTFDQKDSKEIRYYIFDLEESDTLKNELGSTNFSIRRKRLEDCFDRNEIVLNHCVLVESKRIYTDKIGMSLIKTMYRDVINKKGEGLIIKTDSPYQCDRSADWIKQKQILEADLRIIGVEISDKGKRKGKVGALICEDSTGILNVNVGSGFTDSDVEYLTLNQSNIIGNIVSVLFNETIQNKNLEYSLFLPRFVEIRTDKTEPNSLEEIKTMK